MRLPGYGPQGPTLEIYTTSRLAEAAAPAVNRPGFAHLAFEVASVEEACQQVLAAGGRGSCYVDNSHRQESDLVLRHRPGGEYY